MESAEALFAERGFAGTSVRDIADKADVNLGHDIILIEGETVGSLFAWRSESTNSSWKRSSVKPDLSALEKVNPGGSLHRKILLQQNFQRYWPANR